MLRDHGHALLRLCRGLSMRPSSTSSPGTGRSAPAKSPTPCPVAPIKGAHNLLRLGVRSAILSDLSADNSHVWELIGE